MKATRVVLRGMAVMLGVPVLMQAQTAHYPNGVEGLKAATLPPPGLYLRDYNYFYTADTFEGGPPDFDLTVYVQAPRLIWITKETVLGGSYGADVLVPFVYQDVGVGPSSWDGFGLGDVFVEPVTLSWHQPRYDIGLGYGVWAPTGDFDQADPASPGKGYWGHMLTAGATVYLDKGKSWAVTALNRYEINHENPDTDQTPGHAWTLEWGVSKTFNQTLDVGVTGYYQLQTTEDSGAGASEDRDSVFGLGPEVNFFFPKIMLFASARYVYELDASHRPEGHLINVTLTKGF